MKGSNHRWMYMLRFAAAFLAAHTAVTALFLPLQELLPEAQRLALAFFEPYRPLGIGTLVLQLLRASLLAAVFYPFYDQLVRRERAAARLFALLWGLCFLGSIQPMPGSFEGLLYTETTLVEHGAVLAAAALQTGLFIVVFLPWQRRGDAAEASRSEFEGQETVAHTRVGTADRPRGYFPRFLILYVALYLVVGMLFYQLTGYEQALAEMEAFELYRPLENPAMGAAVFLGQFLRGTLLALLLAPFIGSCLSFRFGGLRFFGLYFGSTALGGPLFIPDLFSDLGTVSAAQFMKELFAGVPEITAQILLFSLIFIAWQRRRSQRQAQRRSAIP